MTIPNPELKMLKRGPITPQRVALTLSVICCLWMSTGISYAQTGWLEEGTKMLESLGSEPSGELTLGEIGAGLKDALRVGTSKVVDRLGLPDGFNADQLIHIPLPRELNTVKSVLDTIGMSHLMDDLELKLNRAAEAAVPLSKKHFIGAIEEMTFDDVKAIYEGEEDAATRYFQEKMTPPLTEEIRPIVRQTLESSGAVQAYDQVMARYLSNPLLPDVKADLTDYTIEKGLAGLFHYIAREEAAIRQNPAERTTELLRRVFGGN